MNWASGIFEHVHNACCKSIMRQPLVWLVMLLLCESICCRNRGISPYSRTLWCEHLSTFFVQNLNCERKQNRAERDEDWTFYMRTLTPDYLRLPHLLSPSLTSTAKEFNWCFLTFGVPLSPFKGLSLCDKFDSWLVKFTIWDCKCDIIAFFSNISRSCCSNFVWGGTL